MALVTEVLDGLIEAMNIHRARLEASELEVLRYRSILSPVRRLPLEIVGEILLLVTPFTAGNLERARLLDLTTVCKHWRQAALATHRLWNGLSVHGTTPQCAYDKILLWFRRAGAIPKSLHYEAPSLPCDCDDSDTLRECQATSPLLVHLLSEGPLLQHLKLNISKPGCLRNVMTAIQAYESQNHPEKRPWDSLQSINLVFGAGAQWGEPIDPKETMFSSLPPVKAFRIQLPAPWSSFTYNDDSRAALPHSATIFISRLTTFTVKWDCAGLKLFDLLRHCSNVETLTIDFAYRSPIRELRHTPAFKALARAPLTLPKVTELRLRHTNTDILVYLTTPALTSLDLGLNADLRECDQFVRNVSSFLLRSSAMATVQHLRVHMLTIGVIPLRSLLYKLTALRRLTLDSVACGGLLFFTHSLPPLPLLTELNLLQISVRYNIALDLYLLHTRKNCQPCIVTVTYCQEPCPIRESEWNTFTLSLTRTRIDSTFISLRVLPSLAASGIYPCDDQD
ncbi:hypothetical protein DFP72DRAFT_1077899 [Ephemerocybe angulata]|uniref:F-box domain-containing protein n=1 Tax=Ephemerocybe angulata TaxID=980116 RepID=A0A8H6HDE3_9AGAR|nr:hypothetical protein DFP72DRAFT_1077899 [Tulosesus angulatus]